MALNIDIPHIRNIPETNIFDGIIPYVIPVDLDINSMYPYHMKVIEAPMSEEDAYLHRIGAR